uniref:Putative secreted protein n=1 Tax=Ixodes ricinus TaxID=34613 RepID=A0A6B0UY87_IXORI
MITLLGVLGCLGYADSFHHKKAIIFLIKLRHSRSPSKREARNNGSISFWVRLNDTCPTKGRHPCLFDAVRNFREVSGLEEPRPAKRALNAASPKWSSTTIHTTPRKPNTQKCCTLTPFPQKKLRSLPSGLARYNPNKLQLHMLSPVFGGICARPFVLLECNKADLQLHSPFLW